MSSSDSMSQARLRHARTWWVLGGCIVLTVLVLSLVPSPPQLGGISDKWQHALAYTVMMSWFAQLTSAHLRLALILVLMGIAVEFLQLWGGVRHFELLDMLADAIGVLVGWAIIRLGVEYLRWFDA